VGDDLQEVAAGAVDLGERDESVAEVVTAARAQLQVGEVEQQPVLGVGPSHRGSPTAD
jgi:hypothetical protein